MSKTHRERLEKAGWKVGSTAEFLELSDVETALVEAKLALGDAVRALRRRGHLSQQDLAKRMGSSQSRVAKVENHDPEVSLDLQLRAIFAAHPPSRATGVPPARPEAVGRRAFGSHGQVADDDPHAGCQLRPSPSSARRLWLAIIRLSSLPPVPRL
jgi:transcriptional regulator with XRE-family HTH domain